MISLCIATGEVIRLCGPHVSALGSYEKHFYFCEGKQFDSNGNTNTTCANLPENETPKRKNSGAHSEDAGYRANFSQTVVLATNESSKMTSTERLAYPSNFEQP
ncbi:hypothetical protein MRX96_057913 [Rhipicephalus microplus]